MMEADAPASKRVRVRQNCPYCNISLGKSSYYEHILVCSEKDDSDSAFEVPSEDDCDDVLPVRSVQSPSAEPIEGNHNTY